MSKPRYFHYISTSKVDALYPQAGGVALTLKGHLGFNVGVLNGRLGIDPRDKGQLIKKLTRVEKYLKKNERIGTIERPERWILGSGNSIAISMKDTNGGVFYFLRTENTYIALGGSSGNLISGAPNRSGKFGISFAPDLVSSLLSLEHLPILSMGVDDKEISRYAESGITGEKPWAVVIYDQCHHRRNKTFDTPVTFLARRILEHDYQGKRIILATPLYVEER